MTRARNNYRTAKIVYKAAFGIISPTRRTHAIRAAMRPNTTIYSATRAHMAAAHYHISASTRHHTRPAILYVNASNWERGRKRHTAQCWRASTSARGRARERGDTREREPRGRGGAREGSERTKGRDGMRARGRCATLSVLHVYSIGRVRANGWTNCGVVSRLRSQLWGSVSTGLVAGSPCRLLLGWIAGSVACELGCATD